MLNDYISSQRSAFTSITVLTAFLFITIFDVYSKASQIHKLERTVVTYNLLSAENATIVLPSSDIDDPEIIQTTLKDAGHEKLDFTMALAHLNYAVPIYFGSKYCLTNIDGLIIESRKIIFSWMEWEVKVSPNECNWLSISDYGYPDTYSQNKILPGRLEHIDTDKIRYPYDWENLESINSYADFYLLELLDTCLYKVASGSEVLINCQVKAYEHNESLDLFYKQVGERDYSSIAKEVADTIAAALSLGATNNIDEMPLNMFIETTEDGVALASVELELTHIKTGSKYLLFVSNSAILKHRNNPSLTQKNITNFPLVQTKWLNNQLTSELLLDEIKLFYSNSTGRSTRTIETDDLIDWAYLEVKNFTEGKVEAPFIGSSIPISALIIVCLIAYFVFLIWMYFISKFIKQQYPKDFTMPWLLYFIASTFTASGQMHARAFELALGTLALLMRTLIIVAPSLIILLYVRFGQPTVGYVLPEPSAVYLVVLISAVLGCFSLLIVYLEVSTIKKICNKREVVLPIEEQDS